MASTLALCMIVKNEQQFLPYCLASVHKYCDEIIVVDTGSTDRTIEIAKAFGAYVIQTPWINDFSLVRNISQSAANSDWILWLDGDEVLSDSGIKKIKNQLINDPTADFYLCPRVNFWHDLRHAFAYPDSQYKIYRNNIGLKWHSKLHEKIYDENNQYHRKRLKHCDVHTFHYAYTKEKEIIKKKMQLYIKIENPEMDDRLIEKCSTEHSFFFDKNPPEVGNYNGAYPEVFNKLAVTPNEIRWVDGPSIVKFEKPLPVEHKEFIEIEKIQKETPQKVPYKTNYSNEIEDLASIIIVTHNKVEYLAPLINGIYQSTHINFELIVIDNGSTEQNVMEYLLLAEKEKKNFRFFCNSKNEGFAKGYNAGIKEAKGKWICVLNNDTLVTDGWLERMINHLKEDPEISIIAPVSNNIHGEHQMLAAPSNYSFGDYITMVNKMNQEVGKKRVYSSWTTACCWVFHRDLIEQLTKIESPKKTGLFFDEGFPVGMSEDTDINFYIQHRLHKKMGVARDVFLWHHGSKTLKDMGINFEELQHNNNIILRKKWPEIFK